VNAIHICARAGGPGRPVTPSQRDGRVEIKLGWAPAPVVLSGLPPLLGSISMLRANAAWPPITRAKYALAKNPERSNREIAKDIGVSHTTVKRARGTHVPVRKSVPKPRPVKTTLPEHIHRRIGTRARGFCWYLWDSHVPFN
jgi:hypothetical protein